MIQDWFALEFAEAAMRIAPCYYVTGNHEARISEDDTILMEGKLWALTWDKDTKNTKAAYTILLSHRPEVILIELGVSLSP
ncbi:MAG: hypothetical protein ACI4U1_01210 [Anaerovoracaceae bacterium]